jgi:putative ABC transport system substrate-binding protein
MRLIGLAVVLAVSLTAAPLAAEAQRQHVPRLGFLGIEATIAPQQRQAAFIDGLRALGYVDGRTIAIEYRWAQGHIDRLPALAAELVGLRVDILVTTHGGLPLRAAQKATTTIPIVAMIMNNPVEAGFVASLARPAGNITGQAFQASELSAKQLELLREAVPQLSRVAVLWYAGGNNEAATVRAVEEAAKALKLKLHVQEVREASDISRAVAGAKTWGAQALLQIAAPFFVQHRAALGALLTTHRLPAMCESRPLVVEGCLMTYGASFDAMARRTAYYVDRILRGAKPADLPVEQPTKFEFVINLKTSQALGLTISPSVLGRADEVIQ